MVTRKDTYRYVVKAGSLTVYVGITTDLDRRAAEHRRRWPSATFDGIRSATTRKQALAWEAERVKALSSSTAASVKDGAGPHPPIRDRK